MIRSQPWQIKETADDSSIFWYWAIEELRLEGTLEDHQVQLCTGKRSLDVII